MGRVFTCDGDIEVTTDDPVDVVFDKDGAPFSFRLPRGTTIEVPCEAEVSANLDGIVGITGRAQWECPRCGKTNTRELSADDLG